MDDTFRFIDPDLISPSADQLNRVSELHKKILNTKQELFDLIHEETRLMSDQDVYKSIHPDKESLFRVQWLYEKMFKRKKEIIPFATGSYGESQTVKRRFEKPFNWKLFIYPSAAAVLVFVSFTIIQQTGENKASDKLSYKGLSGNIIKKEARSSTDKLSVDGFPKGVQPDRGLKGESKGRDGSIKGIIKAYPNKPIRGKGQRTDRKRSNEEIYHQAQGKKEEDDIHENLWMKGSSNQTYYAERVNEAGMEKPSKATSKKNLVSPKLRYNDQKAPSGTRKKDVHPIIELKKPSLAILMDTEEQNELGKLDPDNLIFPQSQKGFRLNPKTPLGSQLFIARLNKLNSLIQKSSRVSYKEGGHYGSLNQVSKKHYLYLFSLKVLHYNHLKDQFKNPPKHLEEEIVLLSKVLNIKPVINDLYDVETIIQNRFAKDGRIIWKLSRVLYSLSGKEKLSVKVISRRLSDSHYVYRRLKGRKGNSRGFLSLFKQTISLLESIKKDPHDMISRTALKKLYSRLPIRSLVR